MVYTEKQEKEKLKAAMYAYRVFFYFTLLSFLSFFFVVTLWNVVAELCLMTGFVWHFFIRKHYLRDSYEYQTRPKVIAGLFIIGLVIRTTVMVYFVIEIGNPEAWTPTYTSYSDILDKIKFGLAREVTIRPNRLECYLKDGSMPLSAYLPGDASPVPYKDDLVKLLRQEGVKFQFDNNYLPPNFRVNLPESKIELTLDAFRFITILHVVALIIAIIMFVLFSKFKTVLHAREIEVEANTLTNADPLGIADELKRLKSSG